MPECTGDYLILNGKPERVSLNENFQPGSGLSVYEVFRIINRIPLFIEDHLERFENSAFLAGKKFPLSKQGILSDIVQLIRLNPFEDANIKLLLQVPGENEESEPFLAAFFIEHQYPGETDFRNGVATVTLKASRANPNAKLINQPLRERTNRMKEELGIYEVMLLDEDVCITEASRSNVFFIRGNNFITPPASCVLPGVTRKHAIEAIHNLNYQCLEQPVRLTELPGMEAAFITGTSRKLLPVNRIDKHLFNAGNSLLREAMNEFNRIVNTYLSEHPAS